MAPRTRDHRYSYRCRYCSRYETEVSTTNMEEFIKDGKFCCPRCFEIMMAQGSPKKIIQWAERHLEREDEENSQLSPTISFRRYSQITATDYPSGTVGQIYRATFTTSSDSTGNEPEISSTGSTLSLDNITEAANLINRYF